MNRSISSPPLRVRDGHEARVSYAELFFDLIYVFAVTQVSHFLLGNLTPLGALQALLMWFAVWLGWQYTCWVTNWFDPETRPIRLLLFALMLAGLVMAAALPDAFGERGLIFATAYVAIQVGRSAWVLFHLRGGHALAANYRRILGWTMISAVFWFAGALSEGPARIALWAVAVACEYISPMFGFALPLLGRSRSADWTIEGGHLAERCQLFVIVALGESVLVTGATIAHEHHWNAPVLIAFLAAFIGSLAQWWIYFNTGSKDGSEAIVESDDPGRIGAYFHYVHVIILAGVIVSAVGNDLAIAHPTAPADAKGMWVLIGGPALYLVGNALYKRVVYGRFPISHWVGLAALALTLVVAGITDLVTLSILTTIAVIAVAAWETRSHPERPAAHGHGHKATH